MKTQMRAILLWVLFLLSPAVLNAQVFQWTDGRGVIHWTDSLDSVPEPVRASPSLIVRQDLDMKRRVPGISNQSEHIAAEPTPAPKTPEAVIPPESEQKMVASPNITYYSPQQTNIVVINSVVHHPRKHLCPSPQGCQGVFRPNFDDRRYIHPSVFNGGTRQFIQPELSPSNRR